MRLGKEQSMNMKMREKHVMVERGEEGLRNRKRKDFGVEEEYTLGNNQVKYISAPPSPKKNQTNKPKQTNMSTCISLYSCLKKVPNEKINID